MEPYYENCTAILLTKDTYKPYLKGICRLCVDTEEFLNSIDPLKLDALSTTKKTKISIVRDFEEFSESRRIYALISSKDKVIGLCKTEHGSGCGKKYVWINQFAIDFNYQNEGYGNFLLKYVIAIFKHENVKEIILDVSCNNKPANMLYDSLEFEPFQYQKHLTL